MSVAKAITRCADAVKARDMALVAAYDAMKARDVVRASMTRTIDNYSLAQFRDLGPDFFAPIRSALDDSESELNRALVALDKSRKLLAKAEREYIGAKKEEASASSNVVKLEAKR